MACSNCFGRGGGGGGTPGPPGESAYQIAVDNGFTGTEEEWLASLEGDSAYDVAVANGFTGTEEEWLASLQGPGLPGVILTQTEWASTTPVEGTIYYVVED